MSKSLNTHEKPTVFTSGSCRILSSILDGRNKIVPVHQMCGNSTNHRFDLDGPDFLGKLHSTLQHIQFMRFLLQEINLPNEVLGRFLTAYSNTFPERHPFEKEDVIQGKLQRLRENIKTCNLFIFEICSLKAYETKINDETFQFQFEHKDSKPIVPCSEQNVECIERKISAEELLLSLEDLYQLIPNVHSKKVILIGHFRHNVIWNDPSLAIESRETIYHALKTFQTKHSNIQVCDPSLYLMTYKDHYDKDTHFFDHAYPHYFEYFFTNFIA